MATHSLLRFAPHAPLVWRRLEALPRSGWVKRGIENPETVAEHICALLELASVLWLRKPDYLWSDAEDLFGMLEVHDWEESDPEVGDEITLYGVDSAEKTRLKFERGKAVMERICRSLGEIGERIFAFWLRFETSDDKVAVFARALDKYQAIEQAMRYVRADKRLQGLSAEFITYSPPIEDPVIRERFLSELADKNR
jgi:putative hydrolases of HD superfamily